MTWEVGNSTNEYMTEVTCQCLRTQLPLKSSCLHYEEWFTTDSEKTEKQLSTKPKMAFHIYKNV